MTEFNRTWRASAGKDVNAFVPLKFDLGEAFQFDWSEKGLVMHAPTVGYLANPG